MDSELSFMWPGVARDPRDGGPAGPVDPAQPEPDERLQAAGREIQRLEAANDRCQSVIAAQRRRLLVLERQLEDAHVVPAAEPVGRTSWLDRLLGGSSPVAT